MQVSKEVLDKCKQRHSTPTFLGNSDHLELDDPDSVANHLDQLINNTQQRAVDGRSPCHVQFLANTFSDKPTATGECRGM